MNVSRRWALLLQYEGTEFAGSQWQPNQPTVQGALQQALHSLTGVETPVSLAGRTDAGVHATGQVASFVSDWREGEMVARRLVRGLNHFLPASIAVQSASAVADEFDPRRDAVSRTYHYRLRLAPQRQPLWERFAWVVAPPIADDAAQQALSILKGRRDFAAFTPPTSERSTVRTLDEASMQRRGDSILLTFQAESFLQHQVRRMVGAIVDVARGRVTTEQFRLDVDRAVPGSMGPTAPACGLVLAEVAYTGSCPQPLRSPQDEPPCAWDREGD